MPSWIVQSLLLCCIWTLLISRGFEELAPLVLLLGVFDGRLLGGDGESSDEDEDESSLLDVH